MAKREDKIAELERACTEVLSVCEKYPLIWEDAEILKDKSLLLYNGFLAPDETFTVCIKKGEKTLFGGFYFAGRNFAEEGAVGSCAAGALSHIVGADAYRLRERFYLCFQEVLAEYLAKQKLKELTGFDSYSSLGKSLAEKEISKLRG